MDAEARWGQRFTARRVLSWHVEHVRVGDVCKILSRDWRGCWGIASYPGRRGVILQDRVMSSLVWSIHLRACLYLRGRVQYRCVSLSEDGGVSSWMAVWNLGGEEKLYMCGYRCRFYHSKEDICSDNGVEKCLDQIPGRGMHQGVGFVCEDSGEDFVHNIYNRRSIQEGKEG